MRLLPVLILTLSVIFCCDSLKGPAGPQGEQGETVVGEQGEQGYTGDTGAQGEQGDQGPQGETGESVQGDKGETGDTGPEGRRGETGYSGDLGPMGPRGQKGDQGEQGFPGKDFEFTIIEGKLAVGEPEYWIFDTGLDLQFCIIAVHVRFSGSILDLPGSWLEPFWWIQSEEIIIWNDDLANSGDSYRIIIASEPD